MQGQVRVLPTAEDDIGTRCCSLALVGLSEVTAVRNWRRSVMMTPGAGVRNEPTEVRLLQNRNLVM